jgi:tetratricopeptide (TPR) repeat protein
MYQYIFQLLFLLNNPQYFNNIEQKNVFKKEFNEAYSNQKYKKAIEIYEIIEKTSKIIEPELRINAAQAYFITRDTLKARKNYDFLHDLPNKKQAGLTENQLGLLAIFKGDSNKALKYFQKAIIENPEANEARFNFELIRKLYKPKFNYSPPPPSNTPQNNKQDIIASDQKDEKLDEYKSKKISKEKSLQLLNELKNTETIFYSNKKNTSAKNEKDW